MATALLVLHGSAVGRKDVHLVVGLAQRVVARLEHHRRTRHVQHLAARKGQDRNVQRVRHLADISLRLSFTPKLTAPTIRHQHDAYNRFMTNPLQIGFLVFPDVTQLDLTGPAQVLSRVPGARVHLAWKTLEPMKTDVGFSLNPTTSFADCPPLDVLCVPGGMGVGRADQ